MPFFKHSNIELFFVDQDEREDTSKGIPLVFVHGAGSSHIIWTLQVLMFQKTNRVISIDLSGHGKSQDSTGKMSIENGYAYEVAALVDHLKLNEFMLIGHSMGGGIVMSYVLNNEFQKPKAIALVDTSSTLNLNKLVVGLIIETFDSFSMDFQLDSMIDELERISLSDFQERVKKVDTKVLLRDLRCCDGFDVTDQLSSIKVPAFVIVGDDDDITTPRMALELEQALPRADIAVVKGADHSPMVEQPELFNNMLGKFIRWVEK